MLHPSYNELMKVVNNDVEIGEERFILHENESCYVKSFAPHKTGNNIDGTTVMIGISIKEK